MLLNEFPYWRRNLICVLFSQILVLAGFAAALPFVPLFFRDAFGIADENIRGIYVSLFSFFGVLGYASFCPVWGTLADKYGVKIMLLRGTFAASFIFPLMGYSMSPLMLIALRFVSAAMAGTTSASQMLLVKTVPEDKQGFALGVLSTAYWSGTMLGYTAGGFAVDMYGYKFAFTACGIMYFLAGIFVIFMKDSVKTNIPASALSADCKKIQPEKARLSRSSFRSKRKLPLLYRLPLPKFSNPVWALLLTILFMCLARNFDSPYNAMMVEKIAGQKDAARWTGIISAFVSAGALLSGVTIGYLSDKLKPKRIVIPACVVTCVMLTLQGMTNSLWMYGAARTCAYFCAGALPTVLHKMLSMATPVRKRGMVFGWNSTAGNIGNMLSSVIAGQVIYRFGTRGVFFAAAVLMLCLIPAICKTLNYVFRSRYFRTHYPDY